MAIFTRRSQNQSFTDSFSFVVSFPSLILWPLALSRWSCCKWLEKRRWLTWRHLRWSVASCTKPLFTASDDFPLRYHKTAAAVRLYPGACIVRKIFLGFRASDSNLLTEKTHQSFLIWSIQKDGESLCNPCKNVLNLVLRIFCLCFTIFDHSL